MKPAEDKLLTLLSNNDVTFFIPPFQRNYEWSYEQCETFWNDIMRLSKKNASESESDHFFGAVTYYRKQSTAFGDPAILILIDGQQRITTSMLFLAALRDSISDDKAKENIEKRYLRNERATGDVDEYKIKLKQVETDWSAYKKIILKDEISPADRNSSVYKNYEFFLDRLSKLKYKDDKLLCLIPNGLARFSVITIELFPRQNPWENPQEIFESMNSIGKPLSLADLVRNYLMLGLDSDKQNKMYKTYWLPMERLLPKKMSAFIRDFMQLDAASPYPVASESSYKDLYRSFKDRFDGDSAATLLSRLKSHAEGYALIALGKESGSKKIDRYLSDFREHLKITTAYSFLLALAMAWKQKIFSEADLCEILSAFSIYCIRRRLINGIAKGENKEFPRFVKFIPTLKRTPDKRGKLFELLSEREFGLRLPNDTELTNELKNTSNFYSLALCKFYLATVEECLTNNRPDIINDELLQIEHIMPQTLSSNWISYLGKKDTELHPQYVHSIGNLTLIRHNQKLGNKSFEEKRKIYRDHAGLQIAKSRIVDAKKWDVKAIERRADWIIKTLLHDVLPIPDEMRRKNNYRVRRQGDSKHLSFKELELIGESITFIDDTDIVARVVGDDQVEFEGKKWKLSPLTREIKTRQGRCNKSGSYQGAQYWKYDDVKLADIM